MLPCQIRFWLRLRYTTHREPAVSENNTSRAKKHAWLAIKIALSFGALGWCFFIVDYNKVSQLIGNGDPAVLAWLLPLVIVHTLVGASRFKLLLDPHHVLSVLQHVRQYFIASYFNLILPSSIGGDAVRIFMLGRSGLARSKAATYIFSERLMGLYSLILIAVAAGFTVVVHDDANLLGLALVGLSLLSLAVIYMLMHITRGVDQYHVQAIREAIKDLWAHRPRLAGAVALSILYQVLTVAFTVLVAEAFHLDISPMLLMALVPLVWLVTFLPISIGGVGVRELSFIGLFTQAGLDSEQAIFLSLGTYASMLVAGAMGGIWAVHDSVRYQPMAENS